MVWIKECIIWGLLQLQPVSGTPVFEKISNKSLLFQLGCATSVNIWRDSVV